MALTGNEILYVQGVAANGMPAATTEQTTTQAIANLATASGSNDKVTALNTVGAGTITAAGVVGGVTTRGGTQGGSAFTDTTATAAQIITAMAVEVVGESFYYIYKNNTDATATITGGLGVTVSGFTVVPANAQARYLVTYSAANTVTMVGVQASEMAADAADATKIIGFKVSGATTATGTTIAAAQTANRVLTLPDATTTLAGLGLAQSFTAAQTFAASGIKLTGSSTGVNTFTAANSSATNYTTTVPAVTGVLASTSGSNLFICDIIRCSAQTDATSSTTLANVTGMVATVVPGTYRIRVSLAGTAGASGGWKLAFKLTTTVITSWGMTGTTGTTTATARQHTTTTTDQTVLANSTAANISGTIEGIAVIGTGGTMQLQFAQNASDGTTCSIYTDSYMEFTRIA